MVTALLQAMDTQMSGEPVFNICTGNATSVLELAQTIASLCNKDLAIRFRAAREGEIRHSYGDANTAKLALGLANSTVLGAGLAATLDWLAMDTSGFAPEPR